MGGVTFIVGRSRGLSANDDRDTKVPLAELAEFVRRSGLKVMHVEKEKREILKGRIGMTEREQEAS